MSNIIEAIRVLPPGLFTRQIAKQALATNELCALNYIPEKHLTQGDIDRLTENGKNTTWSTMHLNNIPVKLQTRKLCEIAFNESKFNYEFISGQYKSPEMVEEIMSRYDYALYLAQFIPENHWTAEAVYKGINQVGFVNNSYQFRINHEKLQIFLSYVPGHIKNRQFYHGMVEHLKYPADEIDSIVPLRYKDTQYYYKLALGNIKLVPLKFYKYGFFKNIFTHKTKNLCVSDLLDNEERKQRLFDVLDDKLADLFVCKFPLKFFSLPEKYHTEKRLKIAIKSDKADYRLSSLFDNKNNKLLSKSVMKTYIRYQDRLPEIPAKYWDKKLADYCMKYPRKYDWFEQIPKSLQTNEMISQALAQSIYNIRYVNKNLMTKEQTISFYTKNNDYRKYLSDKYFNDFVQKTGLLEKLIGMEREITDLINKKEGYTRTGNTYIGYYKYGKNYNSPYHLIMTRKKAIDSQPEVLCDNSIYHYHKTWLEKTIADNDSTFIKPKVSADLKDVQGIGYYDVVPEGQQDDIEIYRNTFMGLTVGYCARKQGITYHDDTLDATLEGLHNKLTQMEELITPNNDPAIPPEENPQMNIPLTTMLLHKRLGYCLTGISAFCEDYNLDYEGTYTASQLRLIVREIGHQPSVHRYRQELRKINVID